MKFVSNNKKRILQMAKTKGDYGNDNRKGSTITIEIL
jgi:hypothetical protein